MAGSCVVRWRDPAMRFATEVAIALIQELQAPEFGRF